jgi:AcrR family transcriptional regulator
MNIRENRRAAALDRIADHMLAHGLAPSSLRALAKAAGTSDRMLLYYFADKDEIVVAALQTISARLAQALGALTEAGGRHPPDVVLMRLASIMRGPALKPYMRLALELAALAAHGAQPYRSVAGRRVCGNDRQHAGYRGGAGAPAHGGPTAGNPGRLRDAGRVRPGGAGDPGADQSRLLMSKSKTVFLKQRSKKLLFV